MYNTMPEKVIFSAKAKQEGRARKKDRCRTALLCLSVLRNEELDVTCPLGMVINRQQDNNDTHSKYRAIILKHHLTNNNKRIYNNVQH
mmetsp:Transcript_31944/g.54498  ORF Transcript_31944/g.54498 Transcript_31944/m.54498 type:complete len:88 (-) Transcript_31944:69-332(-)